MVVKNLKNTHLLVAFVLAWVGAFYASQKIVEGKLNKPPIVIGTNTWLGYDILHLARDKNLLPKNVKVVEYNTTSEVIRAYKNGLINALAVTLDEALRLLDEGYSLKIILIFDFSDGADVVIARRDIKRPEDIIGKRVGVEKTALGWYMLKRFLDKYRLKEEDVEVRILELHEHYDAFMKGEVDIIITFEPVKSKILKHDGHIIFSSKEIKAEIIDVLVVDQNLLKHKNALSELVDGYFKAHEFFKKNKKEVILYMVNRHKASHDEIRKALDDIEIPDRNSNRDLIISGTVESSLKKVCHLMKTRAMLLEETPCEDLINKKLVEELYHEPN